LIRRKWILKGKVPRILWILILLRQNPTTALPQTATLLNRSAKVDVNQCVHDPAQDCGVYTNVGMSRYMRLQKNVNSGIAKPKQPLESVGQSTSNS